MNRKTRMGVSEFLRLRAIASGLCLSLLGLTLSNFFVFRSVRAQSLSGTLLSQSSGEQPSPSSPDSQPTAAMSHPLPEMLDDWQSLIDSSDYFEAVSPLKVVGYLIWSEYPVSVYIAPSFFTDEMRASAWRTSVHRAVSDWQTYFPLVLTDSPTADIVIEQASPKRVKGRARSAQASPQAYCKGDRLAHRFTIQISPSQTGSYISAAARHELGHALGIWGHSQNPQDVLYEAQVRQPPPISARDMNTLKKIYEQPTRFGWPAPDYCVETQDFEEQP